MYFILNLVLQSKNKIISTYFFYIEVCVLFESYEWFVFLEVCFS